MITFVIRLFMCKLLCSIFYIQVPDKVWRINLDLPEETRNVTLGNSDERWWEQTELTKLILASNAITELSENVQLLPALSVLDVKYYLMCPKFHDIMY